MHGFWKFERPFNILSDIVSWYSAKYRSRMIVCSNDYIAMQFGISASKMLVNSIATKKINTNLRTLRLGEIIPLVVSSDPETAPRIFLWTAYGTCRILIYRAQCRHAKCTKKRTKIFPRRQWCIVRVIPRPGIPLCNHRLRKIATSGTSKY